jgi:hypothetical protein
MIKILLIFIFFVLPIYLFFKFIKGGINKRKNSFWEGTLIDKEHLEYEDEDSAYTKDLYTLHFETTEGQKVKINVAKNVFDGWEKGDKAKKIEGKLLPDKV